MLSYKTSREEDLEIKFPPQNHQGNNKFPTVLFRDVTYPVIRGHVFIPQAVVDDKRYISVVDYNVQRDLERSHNAVNAVIPIFKFDGAFKNLGVMIIFRPHVTIAGHSGVHQLTFEYDRRGIDMPSELTRIRKRY